MTGTAPASTRLAPGISYFDLHFQGVPRIIATAVIAGPGGAALIDPGPASTREALEAGLAAGGLRLADVTHVLLTHIHLDHAGATGTLVRARPDLRVLVHERGAPHLVDPSRLLASASRLYGAEMDRLWGEVRPVPAEAITTLVGGERFDAGGRQVEVFYTPGHASHHVSYAVRDASIAFVGDTGGVCLRPGGCTVPPTPPPDIDLEAWADSLDRLDRWGCETLFLTHFGPTGPANEHIATVRANLQAAAALAEQSLARGGTDEDRAEWFGGQMRRTLLRQGTEDDVRAYQVAARFDLSWQGLARYWRKKRDRQV